MKARKPRKDGVYVVNVTFTANDLHLLGHADRQGSFTSYVKKLIAEDLEKKSTSSVIESLLGNNDLIKALIGLKQQELSVDLNEAVKEEEQVDENAINEMLDL